MNRDAIISELNRLAAELMFAAEQAEDDEMAKYYMRGAIAIKAAIAELERM